MVRSTRLRLVLFAPLVLLGTVGQTSAQVVEKVQEKAAVKGGRTTVPAPPAVSTKVRIRPAPAPAPAMRAIVIQPARPQANNGRLGDGMDDDDEADAAQNGIVQPQFFIAEENFEQWVFGSSRNAETARTRLDSMLKLQIDEIDRMTKLSEAQKKKLALAARGDVKRLFDQVEEKRRAFRLVQNDQQKFGQFYQELRPLQASFSGSLFGEGSFFAKSLKKTLEPTQIAKYDALTLDRRLFRYRVKVGQVVANLDNTIGFTADQRKQLLKIITEQTRPPRQYGPYDQQFVLWQVSKIPEERLQPIFKDAQWRQMKQQLENARRMEDFLRRQNLLPNEDAVGGKAARLDGPRKPPEILFDVNIGIDARLIPARLRH